MGTCLSTLSVRRIYSHNLVSAPTTNERRVAAVVSSLAFPGERAADVNEHGIPRVASRPCSVDGTTGVTFSLSTQFLVIFIYIQDRLATDFSTLLIIKIAI